MLREIPPINIKQSLIKLCSYFDLPLLKTFPFVALCIENMLFTIAMNSTFVFLPSLANSKGISKTQGALLVSVLGVCDGISRIVMSSLLDLKKVKTFRLLINSCVVLATGAITFSFPAMNTFLEFMLLCCLYGVLLGVIMSQKSVLVVDIFGVEKLASSYGLLLMFQGVGSLIGPPVGGGLF